MACTVFHLGLFFFFATLELKNPSEALLVMHSPLATPAPTPHICAVFH